MFARPRVRVREALTMSTPLIEALCEITRQHAADDEYQRVLRIRPLQEERRRIRARTGEAARDREGE